MLSIISGLARQKTRKSSSHEQMIMNDCITFALAIVLAFIYLTVISTSATAVLVNDNDIINIEKIIKLAILQETFSKTQKFFILEFLMKFKSINAFEKITTEFKNAADARGITISWLPVAINSFRTKISQDLTNYCKVFEVLNVKIESLEQINMEEGFEKVALRLLNWPVIALKRRSN